MIPAARFRVTLSLQADQDLDGITDFISFASPANARAVLLRVLRRIDSLDSMPRRFPAAPDALEVEGELRHVLVSPYRVIYEVYDERVTIHAVRHAARRPISADDPGR